MSTLRSTLRLPVSPASPGAARRALEGLELYVGSRLAETIQLLVSELVTNSVRHGALLEHDLIEVDVTASDEGVRVEVTDPGDGFAADPAPTEPEADGMSGWGLLLTHRLAQRWGVSTGDRTHVWFELPAEDATPTSI